MERLFYEKWPRTLPKAGKFTEPKSSSQRCVRSVLLRQEEKQSRAPSHLTNVSRNLVKSYESLLHNLMLNSLLGLLQIAPSQSFSAGNTPHTPPSCHRRNGWGQRGCLLSSGGDHSISQPQQSRKTQSDHGGDQDSLFPTEPRGQA